MAGQMRCSEGCRRHTGRVAAAWVLLATSATAGAQEVQYGPFAEPVPGLGGLALVALAGLMLFALWRMKKSGFEGGRFLALALMTGALASGISGVKLVADARANGGANIVLLDQAGGGTVQLDEGLNCLRNVTPRVQQILAINAIPLENGGGNDGSCYVLQQGGGPADECQVGTQLQPTLACFLNVLGPFNGGNNGGAQDSDLRLKADLVRVGTAANGLPLYEFRYLGGDTRYRGVMAQDVLLLMPEAVVIRPNGYMAVRYDLLGLEMSAVQH